MLLLIVVSFCLISTTFTWAPDASEDVFKSKFNSQPLRSLKNPETVTYQRDQQTPKNINVYQDGRLPTISKQLFPDSENNNGGISNRETGGRSKVKLAFINLSLSEFNVFFRIVYY